MPPPLLGLKVLELAGPAPSPFAGLILADYGADVVRIDRPSTPFGPPRDTLVRHKRSIVVDFKSPASRLAFLELAKHADVLIDPYRPGVTDRLGVGSEALCKLNPRLIYAHLYGFRPSGRYGKAAGHDINYLAVAGILSLLGRRDELPAPPANILADFAGGGLVCVVGILFALLHRQNSGRGQVVSANMQDGSAYLATFMRQQQGHENNDMPRGENLLDGAAPFYEVYATKDGRFVAVGAQEPQFYRLLLEGLSLEGDEVERLCKTQWDRRTWPGMKVLFAQIFQQKTLHEWRAIFDGSDACVSPVLEMDETEPPYAPLVELSTSPSRDVAVQEAYPELKKGEGTKEVLREWIPQERWREIEMEIDEGGKVLRMKSIDTKAKAKL